MKVIRHHDVAADAPRFGPSPCINYHTDRIGARLEGADDADALLDSLKIQFYHALVLLVRARRVGRDVGRSIARFDEFVLD